MAVAPDFAKTLIGGQPYIGSFAYASLPAATSWSGFTAFANDIGIGPGVLLVSDGTRWMPVGIQVLARTATPASCPADTTEDTLATIVVPANLLGINGGFRVMCRYSYTASVNAKLFKVRFGGTIIQQPGTTSASAITTQLQTMVQNRASAASQIGGNDTFGNGVGTTNQTAAVDTTAAQNITITGQKGLAGETLTLDGYLVEVFG